MLEYWIWLAAMENISRRCRLLLLQELGSPEAICRAKDEALLCIEGVRRQDVQALRACSLDAAKKIDTFCTEHEIHIMTCHDARYPSMLRAIDDAPLLLYYKGTWPDFDTVPSIAAVGSRSASAYGLSTARRMGYQLGKRGAIVVSGMAKGIDAQAMKGALTAGATVVAVLGCGVDFIYPPENKDLYFDTIRHGCIISEYVPQTRPDAWHFPERNRIISGLCDGVLVVEAARKSGALITARLALDQGRDVFAVPGNIGVAGCEGSNGLLKQGAILAQSGTDVIEEYEMRYPQTIITQKDEPMVASDVQSVQRPETKVFDNDEPIRYIDLQGIVDTLPADERETLLVLKNEPMLADDIIEKSGVCAAQVMSALTMLEIKGYVTRLPANRYSLANK